MLRPLGQNDTVTLCGSCDAADDVLTWYSLGDESLGTGTHGTTHRLRLIGEAEDHDRSVTGVGGKRAHSFAEGFELSVGVQQCDIDPSPRTLPNVDFDNFDPRLAGPE